MPKLQNDKHLARFDYDFALQGGAVGVIDLVPNIVALAAGMVISDIYVYVESALTSGGSATVTLGNADPDGFLVNIFALAGSANAVIRSGQVAGALVYDDTNDTQLLYRVGADTDLALTIGTAALTAGKLQVYVEFFAPAAA